MSVGAPDRARMATDEAVRRVGLVVRVSTDRQAMAEEGSLKNQLQKLRKHIEYKTVACGEDWTEAALYELRAVSGKDSMRSQEFQQLFTDIRTGRVNTILCTALDRICRSVKDFLHFFEILNEYGIEFVCLKQNYDTTTSQGKLFITIMMALAEFEREQTAERTREATAARAERGLWNGGRLLGYDADPDRKGSLLPNLEEAALVNFAFDTYLTSGSIKEATEVVNRRGYRTKSYLSRRGRHHPGDEFNHTSMQYLLKNPAYIGKKEVNKKAKTGKGRAGQTYQIVDAVWPAIVDVETFHEVQRLLGENGHTNHNSSREVRHAYVLNGGLLICARCNTPMEGRSGTGRLGVRYYYYACRNQDCRMRVTASEIEGAVVSRIGFLASDGELLERLTAEANLRLNRQAPELEKRRKTLQKSLDEVRATADRIFSEWSSLDGQVGREFLTDKLSSLAQRRSDIEQAMEEVNAALAQVRRQQLTGDAVQAMLSDMQEVYDCLKPYEQKELMRLVVHRAEVSERQIALEIYAGACTSMAQASSVLSKSGKRSEGTVWLPGQDSNLQPSG